MRFMSLIMFSYSRNVHLKATCNCVTVMWQAVIVMWHCYMSSHMQVWLQWLLYWCDQVPTSTFCEWVWFPKLSLLQLTGRSQQSCGECGKRERREEAGKEGWQREGKRREKREGRREGGKEGGRGEEGGGKREGRGGGVSPSLMSHDALCMFLITGLGQQLNVHVTPATPSLRQPTDADDDGILLQPA